MQPLPKLPPPLLFHRVCSHCLPIRDRSTHQRVQSYQVLETIFGNCRVQRPYSHSMNVQQTDLTNSKTFQRSVYFPFQKAMCLGRMLLFRSQIFPLLFWIQKQDFPSIRLVALLGQKIVVVVVLGLYVFFRLEGDIKDGGTQKGAVQSYLRWDSNTRPFGNKSDALPPELSRPPGLENQRLL